MDGFKVIYKDDMEWGDYLICTICGEKVERGIVNISEHRRHCPKAVISFNGLFPTLRSMKPIDKKPNPAAKHLYLALYLDGFYSRNAYGLLIRKQRLRNKKNESN